MIRRSFKTLGVLVMTGAMICVASQAMAVLTDPRPTPEIDPSALRGVLTLIGGGLCVVADRWRRS